MRFLNSVLLLVIIAGCSKSSTAPAGPGTTTLSLVADGITNNAKSLQHSIDSCSNAGGGTLVLPAAVGKYMIGPIVMRSNVNLHLDAGATLLGSSNMNDYIVNYKIANLIGGKSIKNVSITGAGTIDGNGAPWWAAFNADNSITRPRLIYITACTNLTLDGVTLVNSPSFHFVPLQCTNVVVNNVTIYADKNSPNTDGIDPSSCNGVTITNCNIDNGDDNIAIKAADGLCQNITVKHCTFLHGHGLSIGSETNTGFTGLTVDSCSFNGTTNGIRVKSYVGVGGTVKNLHYSNIIMQHVTNPIVIELDYSAPILPASAIPSVSNFTIDSLVATNCGNAGTLNGLSNSPLGYITLSNIDISTNSPSNMKISYAHNVTISNAIINNVTVAPGSGNVTATNVTSSTGF